MTIFFIKSFLDFLYFLSESLSLTRNQWHYLRIGHVTLIKYKYLRLYDKEKKNKRKRILIDLSLCIYPALRVYPSLELIFFSFF